MDSPKACVYNTPVIIVLVYGNYGLSKACVYNNPVIILIVYGNYG